MALGPVLRYELITTSRRGRYYAARMVYGLFLLYSLTGAYVRFEGSELSPKMMAAFGRSMLAVFAWAQWLTLLLVVPAMTAGVIADAHRRQTLRDLLSSGLSARAIVLGKLGARLVHLGVYAAVGLPVVAMVGLMGGLDPWAVFYVYAGTASLALALGGLSVLASTLARRPREAIVAAYALEAAWLGLPGLVGPIALYLVWPFHWLAPVCDLVGASNPMTVWAQMQGLWYTNPRSYGFTPPWAAVQLAALHERFLVMAALQTAFGLVCTALAALALRPLRSGDADWSWSRSRLRARRPSGAAARVTAPARRACGDAPMAWKERHAAPRGGLAWLASRPAVLLLGTLLGCYLFDVAWPSVGEVFQTGRLDCHAVELNGVVREVATWLFAAWLLATASAAAVSVTSEREDDTWTGLTTTLLSGEEVIRAKVAGAVWGARRLGWAWLAVVAVGVVGGAVHPLAAFAAAAGFVVFGGFAAALGVYLSLEAKTSTRALVATVVLLAAINLVMPFLGSLGGQAVPGVWLMLGTSPTLEWASILSYDETARLWSGQVFRLQGGARPEVGPSLLGAYVTSLTLHALAALVLTGAASDAYDRVAGRARRGPRGRLDPGRESAARPASDPARSSARVY